ncbi:MAG: M28 family peptidase [Muribaculaceae bacterium]|nr:M28 family peptidase [Muribaculaceae bacterium]
MKYVSFCLFTLLLFMTSCGTTKKSQQNSQSVVNIEFNADSAYAFCAAQCAFGPRTMNSEAHERCLQWIQQKFQDYGCQVTLQQADLRGYDGTILKSTNIIARQPSAISRQPSSRILVCAHWDSRPWADNDPDSANWRKPVMAANDGASGVAVMLELARLLQQHDSARVAVDFVCFDAEDWGVPQWSDEVDADSWALGAQHWAASYASAPVPAASTAGESQPSYDYAILLDMVGGQGAKFYHEYYSLQYARPVVEKVWQAASAAGYGSFFPSKDGGGVTDDHIPVNEKAHIPCIDIINHYPDCEQSSFGPTWHTVNDDMQHLDKNTLQAVGQTLVQLIYSD